MELPMYALFARKPSIIIRDRDKDKASKQCSAIHFPLISCNDLSTFSRAVHVIQLPDTDINFENSIPTEKNKFKHKTPSTHCRPIFF